MRPHPLAGTEPLGASFTVERFADDDLADVMKMLGQDDAIIAGASIGGGSGSVPRIDADRYLDRRRAEYVPRVIPFPAPRRRSYSELWAAIRPRRV